MIPSQCRVVFLFQYLPGDWDLETYGPNALGNRGFEVEAWDLSVPSFSGLNRTPLQCTIGNVKILRIQSYRELANQIQAIAANSFFVDHIAHVSGIDARTSHVFRLLRKYRARYIVVYSGALPQPTPRGGAGHNRAYFFSRAVKAFNPKRLFRYGARKAIARMAAYGIGYPRPCRIYTSTPGGMTARFMRAYHVSSDTLVLIPSYDYEKYRKYRLHHQNNPSSVCPTCVYIEENLTGHPDFSRLGIRPLAEKPFYKALNQLFDRMERIMGNVVIAAHPRSDDRALLGAFAGRNVVKNRTLELITDCRVVLAHYSTAINFAVMARKPVLFVKTTQMEGTVHGLLVDRFAQELGAPRLNADDGRACAALRPEHLAVNGDAYDQFHNEYIKPKGTSGDCIWDIIAADLHKLWCHSEPATAVAVE